MVFEVWQVAICFPGVWFPDPDNDSPSNTSTASYTSDPFRMLSLFNFITTVYCFFSMALRINGNVVSASA